MANGEMWDELFKRVDAFKGEVEAATNIAAEAELKGGTASDVAARAEIKARTAANQALDAVRMAGVGLEIAFFLWALEHPKMARRVKDGIAKNAVLQMLSNRKLADGLIADLTEICDTVEKELLEQG